MSVPAVLPFRKPAPSTWVRISLCCFAGTLLYAVLRYHVFGTSAWAQFPLWTVNKAVSFTSVILLAAAYLVHDKHAAKRFGLTGFALALLHGLMSMPILTPAYYAKLFDGSRLTWSGELSILTGCVGTVLLLGPAITSLPVLQRELSRHDWLRWQRAGYVALAFTLVHVGAIGVKGWIQPSTWPAYMPPITMLSCLAVAIPLLRRAFTR